MTTPDDTAWTGANGSWGTPGDWSAGIPNSATSVAELGGSGTYTVTLTSAESYAIDAVLLTDANGNLLVDGTLATTQGIDIASGTLINAGHITGPVTVASVMEETAGTVQALAGSIDLAGGDLLFQDTDGSPVLVTNAAGQVFNADGEIGDVLAGSLSTEVSTITLLNAGTLAVGQLDGQFLYLSIDTDTLINTGLLAGAGGDLIVASAALTNAAGGTISSNGGELYLEQGFINDGLVTVSGGQLELGSYAGGSWTNDGTIVASNAQVIIYGDETLAELQGLQLSNDVIELSGTLENAGGSLGGNLGELSGAALNGLEIVGGIVDFSALPVTLYNATLDDVAVTGGLTLTTGELTLSGGSQVYAGSGPALGGIVVAGATEPLLEITVSSGTVIEQPIDVTGGVVELAGGFTLASTITASGTDAVVELLGSASQFEQQHWVNAGSVVVTNGATLVLGGDESLANFGAISLDDATVILDGTLQNAGVTLAGGNSLLNGAELGFGGTIVSGVLDVAASGLQLGQILYAGFAEGGMLYGVTVINGLTMTQGAVTLAGGTTVYADDGHMVGTIVLDGAVYDDQGTSETYVPYLEIDAAPGGTISQPVDVLQGELALQGNFTLTANETASGAGATIALDAFSGGTFVNDGTIFISDGATLVLGGVETTAEFGHIVNDGGVIELAGTLDNAGHLLDGSETALIGANLQGTISGGSLDATALQLSYGYGAELDGVTVVNGLSFGNGDLTLAGGTQVYADDGITPGTILVAGTLFNVVYSYGTYTEQGDPQLIVNASPGAVIDQPVNVLYGAASFSGADFTLQGALSASGPEAMIELDVSSYLTLGSFVNDGVVSLSSGAQLVLGGDETAADYGSLVNDGGEVVIAGTLENTGGTLDAKTTALLGATLSGTIVGGTLNEAALGLSFSGYSFFGGEGAQLDDVALIDGFTLTGGVVTLANGTQVYAGTGPATGTAVVDGQNYGTALVLNAAVVGTLSQSIDVLSGTAALNGNFTLTAPLTASGSGTIQLDIGNTDSFVNDARISLSSGGELMLGGAERLVDYGTIVNNGGEVVIAGTLENAGETLTAADTALAGATLSGTILGGTVDADALALIYGQNAVLDNVAIINGLTLAASDALDEVTLAGSTEVFANAAANTLGTITIGGGSRYDSGADYVYLAVPTLVNAVQLAGGELSIDAPTVALAGPVTGYGAVINQYFETTLISLGTIAAAVDTIDFGGAPLSIEVSSLVNEGLITIASAGTLVIDSALLNTGRILSQAGTVVLNDAVMNTGSISVTDGVLVIGANYYNYGNGDVIIQSTGGSFVNQGSIFASGSEVILSGSESLSNLGAFSLENSTVVLAGTLDGGGAVLDGSGASALLVGATLEDGTIANATLGLAALGLTLGSGAVFDDVALTGGLTLTSAEVTLTGGSTVYQDVGATLGTIVVNEPGSLYSAALVIQQDTPGLLDQPIEVLGGVALLEGAYTLVSGLAATGPDAVLALSGEVVAAGTQASWVNLSTISVSDGATLLLGGDETVGDIGALDNAGGTVVLAAGTLENTGSLLGAGSPLEGAVLSGGTIEGGTLDQAGLGLSIMQQVANAGYIGGGFNSQSALDNVEVIGNLTTTGNLQLTGTTDFVAAAGSTLVPVLMIDNGNVVMSVNNPVLGVDVSLAGGDIDFQSPGDAPTPETIAAGTTISGDGYIEGDTLVNAGVIAATTPGDYLFIEPASLVNTGTLLAENGGILELTAYEQNPTLAGGVYEANSGGELILGIEQLTLAAPLIVTGGTVIGGSYGEGSMTVLGGITLAAGTLQFSELSLATSADLTGYGVIEGGEFGLPTPTFDVEGSLAASGGLLTIDDTLTGAGTLSIGAGATLELTTYASNDVALQGGDAVLVLDGGGSLFDGTISNFFGADQIVINGLAAASATFADGALTLDNGALTLALAGNFTADDFVATSTSEDQTVIALAAQTGQVTLAAPTTLKAQPGIVTAVQGIDVTDAADATVTVQVDAAYGVLDANPENGGLVQGGGTDELLLSGSATAVDAELATLVYRAPNAGQPTDTIVVFASAASGEASALIDVGIDQEPSFALPAAVFLEPTVPGSLDGVTLTQLGAQPDERFTVTVGDQFDTISGSAMGDGTLTGSGGALVTLTGSLTDVNAELQGLSVGGGVSDALTLTAADGLGGSVVAYLAVDLDEPPVIIAPGTFLGVLDEPVGILGISISDSFAAAAGETLSITLSAGTGMFSDGSLSGSSLVFSGTVAELNATLNGLAYTATQQGGVLDPISIFVADAHGGTAAATIAALDLGQPPVFTVPSSILLQADAAGSLPGISLGKFEDISGESYVVYASVGADQIFASSADGGSVFGSGTELVTLSGSLAAVNAELAALTVVATADTTLSLQAHDSDAAGGATASIALDVNVPATVNAPSSILVFGGASNSAIGISVADPYAAATGETLTVTVQDATGTLSLSGTSISGNGTSIVSFSGNLAQINQEIGGLNYTAPGDPVIGDGIFISVVDPSGGTGSGFIEVTPPSPATLTVPTLVAIGSDLESPIDGISVQGGENEPGNTLLTIDVSAEAGVMGLKITDNVAVTGNYTSQLELVGEADAIDTALSSLVYLGGTESTSSFIDGAPQVDDLQVVGIEAGATSVAYVAVTAPTIGSSETLAQPVLVLATDENPLSAAFLQWDQDNAAYVGTLYVNLPGHYNFESGGADTELALTGFDSTIPVSLTSTYSGVGPSMVSSEGTLEAYAPLVGDWESEYGEATAVSLGDVGEGSPEQFSISSTDLSSAQHDTITYIIGSKSGEELLPDRRLTIVFNKPGGTSVSSPSSSSSSSSTSSSSSSSSGGGGGGGGGGKGGGALGDVHLKTFDGLYYDFQATGEFVLAKSTAPGDSYQVQVRLQPWSDSASVSVMTEVAASVGTNRVTFDLTRANTVWVNGAPVTLQNGQSYDLGTGSLEQLSSTTWEVLWDSGETLTVSNAGSFLDVNTTLSKNAAPGSVEGLLGNDNGNPANDLALPDGTILHQPLSFAELYTEFANAWRVTQSTSLLDYGAGQTTATFTDLSFPSDSVSLSNVPQDVYENALGMVAAAGITDPAQQQAAVEDYLLTGDTSFINVEAQEPQSVAAILSTPANPVSVSGLGIGAIEATQVQPVTGPTPVEFIIYTTGANTSGEVVQYSAVSLNSSYLGAADYAGGILPTGLVTLAPGVTSVALTIDVTGTVGAVGVETIGVTLSPIDTTSVILAPSAFVDIESNAPVEGTDAAVTFDNLAAFGTLSGSGTDFTLDLGTLAQESSPGAIGIELVNSGIFGADTVSGLFGNSGDGAFSFVSGLTPVVGLTAGQIKQLDLDINTNTLGAFSDQLTFTASENNGSGYEAVLGTYVLTIDADIEVAPLIHAPPQEIAPVGGAVILGGVSIALPAASLASEQLTIVIGDSAALLSIGNAGFATVTGSGSTQLTITGAQTVVNAALTSLEFDGAASGFVTIAASLPGGLTVTDTVDVVVQPPAIAAADFIAAEDTPVEPGGITVSDPYAQQTGQFVTLTVTDATGLLAIAGTGIAGNGTGSLTFSGTVPELNAELSTLEYTRLASGFAADALTFAVRDPFGDTGTATIMAGAPTLSISGPSVDVTPFGTAVSLSGLTLNDAAAGPAGLVTVTLTNIGGSFDAPALATAPAVTISGSGTGGLTISGALSQVNAELAAVMYTETISSSTLSVVATDAVGESATLAVNTEDAFFSELYNLTPAETNNPAAGGQIITMVMQGMNTVYSIYGDSYTAAQLTAAAAAGPTPDRNFSAAEFTSFINQTQAAVAGLDNGTALTLDQVTAVFTTLFGSLGMTNAAAVQQVAQAVLNLQTLNDEGGETGDDASPEAAGFAPLAGGGVGTVASNIASIVAGLNEFNSAHEVGTTILSGQLTIIGGVVGISGTLDPGTAQNPNSLTPGQAMGLVFGGIAGAATDFGLSAAGGALGKFSGLGGVAVSLAQTVIDTYNNYDKNGRVDFSDPALTHDLLNIILAAAPVVAGLVNPLAGLAVGVISAGLQWWLNNYYSGLNMNGDGNGSSKGDVHLTTFSNQLYDFQAAGEFTLVQSTQTGNLFDIQIRLQPWFNSASVSVMTQIGMAVGTDSVTFGIGRGNVVYVDGAASTLSESNPVIALNGGYLTQISADAYAVFWNTGEIAEVTNNGSYLSINVTLGPNDGANSVQGLLGPNDGAANDFELPDGTVLAQPLTSSELYTTFANAWRITQADSLLNYGAGQSTATYTETSFPGDAISLASLPTAIVAQAQAAVAAAGITNPAEAQAAELDYIATGDLSFVATDGELINSSISSIAVTSSVASVSEGIFAEAGSVVSGAAAVAMVPLEIYLTGTAATAEVIDYGVVAPDADDLGIVAFNGTLPGGSVTIAAGQSTAQVTIALPAGILGSLASAPLEVTISSTGGTALFAPMALTEIVNATPEAGPAAVPAVLNLSGTGLLVPESGGYVLDLGTLVAGMSLAPALLEISNDTTLNADLLGGSFGIVNASGFSISSAVLGEIAAGGTVGGLSITALSGAAGSYEGLVFYYPTDSNATGYASDLAPVAVNIEDAVVNAAAASFAQAQTINFGTVHVGEALLTALTISNDGIGPAAGLDVGVEGFSGDASGAGMISQLAAGATDHSDVQIELGSASAGVQSGQVTLSLASDTAGPGSLGYTMALPDTTFDISATVLNYATAALEVAGSLAPVNGTLDLGTISGSSVIDLAVLNSALGPADLLEGDFIFSGSSAFTNTGFGNFSGIAAEGSLTGLTVTLTPVAPGEVSETITLDPTGYETSGYSGALGAETLVIEAESAECFCLDTNILTPRGPVAVQDLRIGDEVLTAQGRAKPIKWIGRHSYDGRFIAGQHLKLPVTIRANAIADHVPCRDLSVSPGHAIGFGETLVPAWRLVNGVSITQAEAVERVDYFHIELFEHDLILAENCPAESFYDDDCRMRFHNAEEYAALYGDTAMGEPLSRTEGGFALDRVRRAIMARAGVVAEVEEPGELRGYIDVAGPEMLKGWAQDLDAAEEPVMVDVIVGGKRIARLLANHYRADLRDAGVGSGCHGFEFVLPPGISDDVTVRRTVDRAVIPLTAQMAAARRRAANA